MQVCGKQSLLFAEGLQKEFNNFNIIEMVHITTVVQDTVPLKKEKCSKSKCIYFCRFKRVSESTNT